MAADYRPDIEQNKPTSVADFFELKKATLDPASAREYAKAVTGLSAMLPLDEQFFLKPDQTVLANWFIKMIHSGMSLKTCITYLNSIAAIFKHAVKECGVAPSDTFRDFRKSLKEIDLEALMRTQLTLPDFERFIAALRSGNHSIEADLIRLSMMNGAMPPVEVARLTKDDADRLSPHSADIIRPYASARRRYLLPLSQSTLSPRQLDLRADSLADKWFRVNNLPLFGSATETLQTYWAYAALHCGVAPSEILASLPEPPRGIPSMRLLPPLVVRVADPSIRQTVSNYLLTNPRQWFAMRLRHAVRYSRLQTRLQLLPRAPELFYPCEEIYKRTGRKLQTVTKPIIPDIVFFKTRLTDVQPLFARIGDLAWCYRNGATYAPIPARSMTAFQETIGHFTADYEVAPIGQLQPRPGERLKIIGGLLMGHDAGIEAVDPNPSDSATVYRMKLTGSNGFDWRIKIDSRLLASK